MSPSGIAQVLRDLPGRGDDPNFLVGTETSDDAGVYRLAEGLALVQTLDFFPPSSTTRSPSVRSRRPTRSPTSTR